MQKDLSKIKMRVCKDEEAVCKVCGIPRNKCIEIFEIAFTEKQVIRICDLCNEQLFVKTLRASSMVNGKIKSKQDMNVIANRKRGRM